MINIRHCDRYDEVFLGNHYDDSKWQRYYDTNIVLRHHRYNSYKDVELTEVSYSLVIVNDNYDSLTKAIVIFRNKYSRLGKGNSYVKIYQGEHKAANRMVIECYGMQAVIPNFLEIRNKRKVINDATIKYMSEFAIEIMNDLMVE